MSITGNWVTVVVKLMFTVIYSMVVESYEG